MTATAQESSPQISMPRAQTDKAVILAAGLGTRMRKADGAAALDERQSAVADTGVKALIPIERPFLDYVLHSLVEAGYRSVCLVIGPDHHELRRYYGQTLKPRQLKIEFAVQARPLGTADAVLAAESFAGDDRFLMINSDNYYPASACRALRCSTESGLAAFEQEAMLAGGNIPPERVQKFAVVVFDDAGYLQRVIEKPDESALRSLGSSVFISMNCWAFGPSIFEACRWIKPSPRGGLEITDAVQYAVDQLGERFRVFPSFSAVLDLSSRADIAPVTARLAGLKVEL